MKHLRHFFVTQGLEHLVLYALVVYLGIFATLALHRPFAVETEFRIAFISACFLALGLLLPRRR